MYQWCMLIVNDSLDDILGESGDEEEQDAVVTQVLDEIGIEISGKVCLSLSLCLSTPRLLSVSELVSEQFPNDTSA